MRVLVAVILFGLGIAGVGAADLSSEPSANYSTGSPGVGHRIGQLVVYDVQQGVVVRAYWRAPWRNRHYFPTTGGKPEIGRDEDLSGKGDAPEPAETFQRSWSTSSAFLPERPLGRQPLEVEPPQNPAPLK